VALFYSKELKSYVHTKTCTQIFILTLLILPKLERNQDVLHQVRGYIMCDILRQFCNIKAIHEKTWRKLKGKLLSERKHCEKVRWC
jgi:hypothetical protein